MSQVAVDDSSHTNTTFTHLAKAKKEDGPLKIVGFEPLAKRRKAADRNATFLIWLCLIPLLHTSPGGITVTSVSPPMIKALDTLLPAPCCK